MDDEMHTLTGAYAMDALSDDERAEFEAYLAASPSVAAEVDSLREAVAALGTAAAKTPPEGLRRAVMDRVDVTRQEPPLVTSIRPSPTTPPTPDVRPDQRVWLTRLSLAAAAAAVVVSVGLGASLARLGNQVEQLQQTSNQIAGIVAAPDARQSSVTLPAGGQVVTVTSDENGAGVVVGRDLAALDANQMYALWGISSGVPVPIGEIVDGQPLPVDAALFQSLGITIEPRGELVTPTTAVIATLPA